MQVLKKEKEKENKWEEGSRRVRPLVGVRGLWGDPEKQYMVGESRGISRRDADIQVEIVFYL